QIDNRAVLLQYSGKFMVDPHAFVRVQFQSTLLKQSVNLRVIVAKEVELAWCLLRRMPDTVLIRVQRQAPAQDNGIEFAGFDESTDKTGPLQYAYSCINTNFF